MKDGDEVRSKFNNLIGRFVKVDEYTGYIDGDGWRSPECTIKDIAKYWRVIGGVDSENTLPFR